MDKETRNITVIKDFMENHGVEHLSRAMSKCIANVEFEGLDLDTIQLSDSEIFFEHSYNNTLRIPALQPPYFSEFWTTRQNFCLVDETMLIEGVSPAGLKYKVKVW